MNDKPILFPSVMCFSTTSHSDVAVPSFTNVACSEKLSVRCNGPLPGSNVACICAPVSSTTVLAAVLAARRRSLFLFLCEACVVLCC